MDSKEFFASLIGKKVGVIGYGVSHRDLISLLLRKGISVTLLDRREKESFGEEYARLERRGARFVLGEEYLDNLKAFDVVFRTPGMYYLSPKLIQARKQGVVLTSEMEVFFDLCPCKVYGVTGSDGKTTTTTLISEMLKASGKRVYLGGNIGKALLPLIEEIQKDDVCIVELSSFQLISMRKSPDVAVVTNLAPNHLDVHRDMEEYIGAKKNLLLHQNAFSRSVLNFDNKETKSLATLVRGELCGFSRHCVPDTGSCLDENGYLCSVENGAVRRIVHKDEIKLPGLHNLENYLAAIAAVSGAVCDEAIQETARTFSGVEHRIEYVCSINGVRYYNDSIVTSPTRTIAGLNAFDQKLIIIAGGYDKKIPYAPLAPVLCERAKLLILLGATARKIEEAVQACDTFLTSGLRILHADSLENAVTIAAQQAKEGDIVSLSPASASFDLYKNFEERGQHFKDILAHMVQKAE